MKLSFTLAVACLIVFLALPVRAADGTAASKTGLAMADAAQRYLAAVDDDERAKVAMDFDDPRRLDWHNIPKPERKGIQLRDMSAEEQELCHGLLRTALSDAGYEKAVRILSLENNLKEGEKNDPGAPLRDPLRYFLTIFGTPGAKGTWGWSFEGHHCSLNFVISDGQVVCDSPSFWGANPATVKILVEGGPEVGVRTLADEEQLAFDLVNSLDDGQRAEAVIADKAPADYRAPGEPQPPHTPPAGLAAAEMNDAQRESLRKLLAVYSGHLAADLAAARMKDVDDQGFDRVHFAWQGATKPGVPHAYRIQGPTFLLELVNYQSDPAGNPANHIHSVWRSLAGDFGVAAK